MNSAEKSIPESLEAGEIFFYTISIDPSLTTERVIQENYFCNWEVELDRSEQYLVSIDRSRSPTEEYLTLIAGVS